MILAYGKTEIDTKTMRIKMMDGAVCLCTDCGLTFELDTKNQHKCAQIIDAIAYDVEEIKQLPSGEVKDEQ